MVAEHGNCAVGTIVWQQPRRDVVVISCGGEGKKVKLVARGGASLNYRGVVTFQRHNALETKQEWNASSLRESVICYQRHQICSSQFLGVSFGILSFTDSTCCRWTLSLWGFATTPRLASRGYLSTWHSYTAEESTVTLLRSLQYGSKFGLRPLFAYQDQTRGRVLVQLYSGNVVFLDPPSLEEYHMLRVQRFNIQCRIYTYVNYTLQFSSEPMQQLSMSLSMTNMSTPRFNYTASTVLYFDASSQQRSYFSVLEQVAQASRLQQQLRLFLQDEDNPSLNNSLTSANVNVITQKIENFSPTVSFVYSCLSLTNLPLLTLLTYDWTIRLSYLATSNLCNRFRPQARAFRIWTTKRFHRLRHHITRHFPRPASLENADSATPPESVELRPVPRSARLCRWAPGCWNATVELSLNVLLA